MSAVIINNNNNNKHNRATETISKSLRKYPSNKPGKHEIRNCKKAVMGTAHILRKVLMYNVKVQNILHGRNNITCHTDCKYRTAVTLFTLKTWFVSGT
jgi:hypothetical protein